MHKMAFYLSTYDTFVLKNYRQMKQTRNRKQLDNHHSLSPYATVTRQGKILDRPIRKL